MSNIIDSIQLSGVTYGIKGSGGTETIELTQAQYDALVDKDPNTFYVITDAQAGDLTNYYTKTETNTLLSGKQDTLVSSQNIKTINNESILGSGNIDIQGGSITIDPSLDSGSTNAVANSAITNAFNSFVCRADYLNGYPRYYQFRKYGDNSHVQIYNFKINGTHVLNRGFAAGGVPYNYSLIETSAITTSISSSSTDSQVPSAKAVNDKLGGLSIVKLTQAEYDALATKDNSTLYVIIN